MAWILPALLAFTGCQRPQVPNDQTTRQSPVATGDERALALADAVLEAMGGAEEWSRVPYVTFTFFGNRKWYWDKHNGQYRVESEKRGYRIAGRLDGSETHLWLGDREESHPDSIAKYGKLAYEAWVNDTYWLIMPFKLKDPGVRLAYAGECAADSLTNAICIDLTFDAVGVTPENKYRLYVDTANHHIIRWDYFRSAADTLPALSTPWTGYAPYGNVILSGSRGDRQLTDIHLPGSLPDELFTNINRPATAILNSQ